MSLIYHSLPFYLGTGFLIEPGARLVPPSLTNPVSSHSNTGGTGVYVTVSRFCVCSGDLKPCLHAFAASTLSCGAVSLSCFNSG